MRCKGQRDLMGWHIKNTPLVRTFCLSCLHILNFSRVILHHYILCALDVQERESGDFHQATFVVMVTIIR